VLVLALDTASAATSVAVGEVTPGDVEFPTPAVTPLAERSVVAANRHGELLAPMISDVLAEAGAAPADLTGIVVGVGPGPFTGLRVGMMTGVALGQALGIEVTGGCSLDAVAFGADRPWDREFAVLGDARRKEVYWARYGDDRRLTAPAVTRPADLDPADLPDVVVGAGALLHRDALPAGLTVEEQAPYPSAAALLRLGLDPAWRLPVRPLYLRRPDAQPPARPKAVTPA